MPVGSGDVVNSVGVKGRKKSFNLITALNHFREQCSLENT